MWYCHVSQQLGEGRMNIIQIRFIIMYSLLLYLISLLFLKNIKITTLSWAANSVWGLGTVSIGPDRKVSPTPRQ